MLPKKTVKSEITAVTDTVETLIGTGSGVK